MRPGLTETHQVAFRPSELTLESSFILCPPPPSSLLLLLLLPCSCSSSSTRLIFNSEFNFCNEIPTQLSLIVEAEVEGSHGNDSKLQVGIGADRSNGTSASSSPDSLSLSPPPSPTLVVDLLFCFPGYFFTPVRDKMLQLRLVISGLLIYWLLHADQWMSLFDSFVSPLLSRRRPPPLLPLPLLLLLLFSVVRLFLLFIFFRPSIFWYCSSCSSYSCSFFFFSFFFLSFY